MTLLSLNLASRSMQLSSKTNLCKNFQNHLHHWTPQWWTEASYSFWLEYTSHLLIRINVTEPDALFLLDVFEHLFWYQTFKLLVCRFAIELNYSIESLDDLFPCWLLFHRLALWLLNVDMNNYQIKLNIQYLIHIFW